MTDTSDQHKNPVFRERLASELRVSRRMLRQNIDVVPRFVMECSTGERITVLTNLAASGQQRSEALYFVADFLTLHMCRSFVLAYQGVAPVTLTAVLVSMEGRAAATQSTVRANDEFGDIVFHDPRHTDSDILTLLPGKRSSLSRAAIASINAFKMEHEIAPRTFVLEI